MKFYIGSLGLAGLLAGCAWDNSPTPLHSEIRMPRMGTDTGLAAGGARTNTLSGVQTFDTNQIQGVGGLSGGGGVGGSGAANTITGTNSAFDSSASSSRIGVQTNGFNSTVLSGTNSVSPAATSPLNGGLTPANPGVGTGLGGVTPAAGTATIPNNSALSQPNNSPSSTAGAAGTHP
jgi:hypothetical protein